MRPAPDTLRLSLHPFRPAAGCLLLGAGLMLFGCEASSAETSNDETSSDESSDDSDDTGSGMSTGPAICGNGVVEDGEACDDGDERDGNGCNVDCRPSGEVIAEQLLVSEGESRAVSVATAGELVWVGGSQKWIANSGEPFVALLAPDLSQAPAFVDMQFSRPYGNGEVDVMLGLASGDVVVSAWGGYSGVPEDGKRWIGRITPEGEFAWRVELEGAWSADDLNPPSMSLGPDNAITFWGQDYDAVVGLHLDRETGEVLNSWKGTDPFLQHVTSAPRGDGSSWLLGAQQIPGSFGSEPVYFAAKPEAGLDPVELPIAGYGSRFARRDAEPTWVWSHEQDAGGNWSSQWIPLFDDGQVGEAVDVGDLSDELVGAAANDFSIEANGDFVVSARGERATGFVFHLSRFGPDGQLLWDRSWGDANNEIIELFAHSAAAHTTTADGNIVAVGQLRAPDTPGPQAFVTITRP